MPQRKRIVLKAVFLPLSLLAMAVAIFRRKSDAWEYEWIEEAAVEPLASAPPPARRPQTKRYALTVAFSALFFAGAAFTAGAGDQMARLMDEDAAALEAASSPDAATAPDSESSAPEAAPQAAPADPAPAEAAPAEAAAAEAAAPEAAPAEAAPAEAAPTEAAPAETPDADTAPAEAADPSAEADPSTAAAQAAEPASEAAAAAPVPAPSNAASAAPARKAAAPKASTSKRAPAAKTSPAKKWVVKRAAAPPAKAPEVEVERGGEPTIWLNRALPDPTPASARLHRAFAKRLVASSKRHGADWAAVLGVLRAQGERGSAPGSAQELDALAARMAGTDAWKGALALSGRTGFADRAAAFADLYRFVGVEALVNGYAASKVKLGRKVLSTPGILVYGGGRSDIMMGRIDVRVLVLVGYLAERHGSITISSLFSGHRTFARPGVVSAHVYGHAVDIAAVGGTPIAGHQQPGGLTEAAVRSVLLLPGELQPQQVISLLGLGGPSFPLRDHGDHIHVGF
jgi:hypothetical protein